MHYPILSLVSKGFRSLTSSRELYQNRFLLNRTENCLYVCLQFPTEPGSLTFVGSLSLGSQTKPLAGPATVCLIEKRYYRYESNGELLWSNDGTEDGWKKVEGLEGLPKFARYSNVNLVESGGKMVVFWDKYVPAPGGYKEKMIRCAEVSLEMRSSEEVLGKVERFGAVLCLKYPSLTNSCMRLLLPFD
ncbi:unnamed protein product [Brassica rapa subsp. trilocularis]